MFTHHITCLIHSQPHCSPAHTHTSHTNIIHIAQTHITHYTSPLTNHTRCCTTQHASGSHNHTALPSSTHSHIDIVHIVVTLSCLLSLSQSHPCAPHTHTHTHLYTHTFTHSHTHTYTGLVPESTIVSSGAELIMRGKVTKCNE